MFIIKDQLVDSDQVRAIYDEAVAYHYEHSSGIIEREVAVDSVVRNDGTGEYVYHKRIVCKSCGEQFKNIAKARVHYRKKNCHEPRKVIRKYIRSLHEREDVSEEECRFKFHVLEQLIYRARNLTYNICRTFEVFKQEKKIHDVSGWNEGQPSREIRNDLIEIAIASLNYFSNPMVMLRLPSVSEKFNDSRLGSLKREKKIGAIARIAVENMPTDEEYILSYKRKVTNFDDIFVKSKIEKQDWNTLNKLMYYKFLEHKALRKLITEHIIEQNNENTIFDYFFDTFVEDKDESLEQLQEHVNVSIAMEVL